MLDALNAISPASTSECGVERVQDAEQLVELLADRVDRRERRLHGRDAGQPEQRPLQLR